MSRCSVCLAIAAAAALLAIAPDFAFAHGGEEEALEKTPARALAQQALALLSQEESAVEAHERVEAALESEDRDGVDEAKLRETQRAFEAGDHELAARLLDAALAGQEPRPGGGADEQHEETTNDPMVDGEAADIAPQAASFEHTREFEPDRATAEWVALAIGLLAVAAAAGALARGRGDRAA